MRMNQETYKKGYYIPELGKTISITRDQDIDENGIVGKSLVEHYGEDVIGDGESQSTLERLVSGELGGGGSSLTTEQTATLTKLDGIESTGVEIDLMSNLHHVPNLANGTQSRLLIQAELDKGGVVVISNAGEYLIDTPLQFGDYTTLHLYEGVTIKNTASEYMAINKDTINGNVGIHLIGGHYDCDNMGATGAYPSLYPGHAIFFHNVTKLKYLDLKVSHAQKYAFLSVDITDFEARNIDLDTDSDGLHFQSPIKGAIIENIRGRTEDDMLAFTLGDYVSYQVTTEGDFEDVAMRNIFPSNAKAVLKMIGSGTDSLYKFKNFTLDNVYGTCYAAPIAIVDGSGLGAHLINTRVENVIISNIKVNTDYANMIDYTATGGGDLTLNSCRPIDKKFINFDSQAILDTLTINGVKTDSNLEITSKTFTSFDGTIGTLNINDFFINLNASTAISLVGTIDNINFNNLGVKGVANSADKLFSIGNGSNIGLVKINNLKTDNIKYFVSALEGVTFMVSNAEFKNVAFTGTFFFTNSADAQDCRIIGTNFISDDTLKVYTTGLGTVSVDCKTANISDVSKLTPLEGDIVSNGGTVKIYKSSAWSTL